MKDLWAVLATILVLGILFGTLRLWLWRMRIRAKKRHEQLAAEIQERQNKEMARHHAYVAATLPAAKRATQERIDAIEAEIDKRWSDAGFVRPLPREVLERLAAEEAREKEELRRAEEERLAARKIAARREKLRQAEAAGESVCWKCETINPKRCWCRACISDNGPDCTNYYGYCVHHG